jgi:hypothetical protein
MSERRERAGDAAQGAREPLCGRARARGPSREEGIALRSCLDRDA